MQLINDEQMNGNMRLMRGGGDDHDNDNAN